MSKTAPAADRIAWLPSIPFIAVHVVALATPFLVPGTWGLLGLAAATWALRLFGITAGYHRYFSHRAYKTSRAFQLVLAVLGTAATQKGPLWWAAHHRDHHRFSDRPQDIHSPVQRGFLWSHMGWFLSRAHEETKLDRVKDLARFPELRWLDRWHVVPPIALGAVLFLAGGWAALLWGYFVSTVVLWHCTYVINSLAHVIGRKRYETGEGSRNSLVLALLTFGEGWHNNHHYFAASANQGFFWWEIDVSYYALRALSAVGIVRDLRKPPEHVRMAHKQPRTARAEAKPASESGVAVAAPEAA
ncbi:MAG: fatty acid desaturase [Anaeromyxobacter sp.]